MWTAKTMADIRDAMMLRGSDLETTRAALVAKLLNHLDKAEVHRKSAGVTKKGSRYALWAQNHERNARYIEAHLADREWLAAMMAYHIAQNDVGSIGLLIAEKWPMTEE